MSDKETQQVNSTARERLRNAINNSAYITKKKAKSAKSEKRHTREVPFEGNVHIPAGYSLTTEEIDKKFRKSAPSIWWLMYQSLLLSFYKLTHRH